jgi:hypothetical protein
VIKNFKINLLTFLSLLLSQYFLLQSNASAQVIDSMYYGWVVYEIGEGDERRCYTASAPHTTNSSYTSFRAPYLAVTRYYKNRNEEISVYSGYEYKINSDIYLLIGANQKEIYTKGDMAWAKSDYDDKEIITLMLRNAFVKVRSDSSFGNFAIDEYQLKGFARAYARIKELCE